MSTKPLKILILDNSVEEKSYGSRNLVQWTLKSTPLGTQVFVRRGTQNDLPVEGSFDAILISGSLLSCVDTSGDWTKAYDEFIISHIKKGTPMLGVCYGHQAIARCLFSMNLKEQKMGRSEKPECGWQTIQKVQYSPLFESLPDHFVTSESHYEEVYQLPPGTIHLARSERCEIQAFQVKDKPIFGIQFHPEHPLEEVEESLAKKIKKGENREWILNPGQGRKLYDINVGTAIFGNFFKLAEAHAQRSN